MLRHQQYQYNITTSLPGYQLHRSKLSRSEDLNEARVSHTAWLQNSSHPILERLAHRIAYVTQLFAFENTKGRQAAEHLQVRLFVYYNTKCFWTNDVRDQNILYSFVSVSLRAKSPVNEIIWLQNYLSGSRHVVFHTLLIIIVFRYWTTGSEGCTTVTTTSCTKYSLRRR